MKNPPIYNPIQPIEISDRWFPARAKFGLYESSGIVAPNVTSILGWKFPFDKSKWIKSEPHIDHDLVARESAERGTAVHLAMECWLRGERHTPDPEFLPWIRPLQLLVAKADTTLGVEVPVHHHVEAIGAYAGSCDGLMQVGDEVVICDYKTKRAGKRVYAKYCDQQKLQLAAYSLAINAIYENQLPAKVSRVSLLFAHPEPNKAVSVISVEGADLLHYQGKWLSILGEWYSEFGDSVVAEQKRFDDSVRKPF